MTPCLPKTSKCFFDGQIPKPPDVLLFFCAARRLGVTALPPTKVPSSYSKFSGSQKIAIDFFFFFCWGGRGVSGKVKRTPKMNGENFRVSLRIRGNDHYWCEMSHLFFCLWCFHRRGKWILRIRGCCFFAYLRVHEWLKFYIYIPMGSDQCTQICHTCGSDGM